MCRKTTLGSIGAAAASAFELKDDRNGKANVTPPALRKKNRLLIRS
jgi:hypothetical protein